MNNFEIQLKQFFPDIYALYLLMKDSEEGGGGEKNILILIDLLLDMNQTNKTGIIFINYSRGRIDNISLKQDITAFKGAIKKPSLDKNE